MTNTRLELCNMIRMEAEHVSDTGFPLDVFPQAVQSVILDMDRYENYKTEFIATAMLSAVSAALGGTYRIRCIHGCHGGTVLRDMIRGEYARHPRVIRLEVSADGGTTDLVLREL